jgi:hypothetical protein
MGPEVDVVILTRTNEPLGPAVAQGLQDQRGVRPVVHRVVGSAAAGDRCRGDAIVRGRNAGKSLGRSPWLMFLDDDVVLAPDCIATLLAELNRRPQHAALAADYRGERRPGRVASHVAMGATLFRRRALEQMRFAWRGRKCECQGCCDDLRKLHWGIDYCETAKARHLPKDPGKEDRPDHVKPGSASLSERDTRHYPSVRFVVPYFGRLPGWIELYFLSCLHNPSVDFLLLTDQDNVPPVPANVQIERLDIASFNARASEQLGFRVSLSRPYKLCDFRPAFGLIFQDLLEGWDYWGYTDLDVVYGDIRRQLTLARLQNFDVFAGHRFYLPGHFTLLRNSPIVNRLFQRGRNYREVLQAKTSFAFDECGNQWRSRVHGAPLKVDPQCDSMTHIVQRALARREVSACLWPGVLEWPELGDADWRLRWRAGRLWRLDVPREAMYFHFCSHKKKPGFCRPQVSRDAIEFDITLAGFGPPSMNRIAHRPHLQLKTWA